MMDHITERWLVRLPGRGGMIVGLVLLASVAFVGTAFADGARVGSEAEVIAEDGVNLRSGPGTDSEILTLIGPARYVFVLDGPTETPDGDWYEVEFDGDVGWVLGDNITLARGRDLTSRGDVVGQREQTESAAPQSSAFQVGVELEVTTDALNIRAEPGQDAEIIAVAEKWNYVYVKDGPEQSADGDWYFVDFDGDQGWVLGTYLGPASARGARAPTASRRAVESAPAPRPASRGQAIASRALQFVGYPYVWGGASPSTGFDCSGLIQYVMGGFGVYPGRTTDAQAGAGYRVSTSELQPGDIVIFANTYGWGYTHSGIYIGGGSFVHAEDYGTGVRVSSLFGGFWGAHYAGARRPW